MNREAIDAQVANLNAMKLAQQERLQRARAEVQGASSTLERIEGGLEICRWMLEQLPEPTEVKISARVNANGELVPEPLPERNES